MSKKLHLVIPISIDNRYCDAETDVFRNFYRLLFYILKILVVFVFGLFGLTCLFFHNLSSMYRPTFSHNSALKYDPKGKSKLSLGPYFSIVSKHWVACVVYDVCFLFTYICKFSCKFYCIYKFFQFDVWIEFLDVKVDKTFARFFIYLIKSFYYFICVYPLDCYCFLLYLCHNIYKYVLAYFTLIIIISF